MKKIDKSRANLIYRPEIDGLRALAVLSVVLYHAGYSMFEGGFVGVDVFFVVSGFLITSVIIKDLDQNNFSFLSFYARRARRLAPALLLVLIATIPISFFVLLPSHLAEYSKSILAVITFSSNVFFFRNTGYFEIAAEVKPLLHTWSLSLEEQFYFIFPIWMFVLFKIQRKLFVPTTLMVILISLLISEWGSRNAPVANFFLLPARIWELCIGSLIAYVQIEIKGWWGRSIGYIGLLGIFISIATFNELTPFPSMYGLIPVIGTSMVLLGDYRSGFLAKVLKSKVLIAVGLMSYSIYLWHQPIFSFAQLIFPGNFQLIRPLLIILTLFISYLSWKFVEVPFRNESMIGTRRFSYSVASVAVLCSSFAVLGIISDGFTNRYESPYLSFETSAQYLASVESSSVHCEPQSVYVRQSDADGVTRCHQSRIGEPDIAILGDSHAEHLFPGLRDHSEENVVYYIGGLPSLDNELYRDALQSFEQYSDTIIVSARYITAFDDEKRIQDFVDFIRNLDSREFQIYIIGDVPKFTFDPESCVYASGDRIEQFCGIQAADWKIQKEAFEPLLRSLSSELRNTTYLSLDSVFCTGDYCSAISSSNELLFRDRDHLSTAGSQLVGQYLAQQINRL